jgi:hypothetical protein
MVDKPFPQFIQLLADWKKGVFVCILCYLEGRHKNGRVYSSVGRKYSTGPILQSDGQIAQFISRAIRPS